MNKLILVVEDEKPIVDILNFNLGREGYRVEYALDGEEGLKKALELRPDLILLDVMLPAMDGFEVCRRVREVQKLTPIIMLTAREEETDKVLGLELGADDYITKPFSMRELLARVKANIRRGDAGAAEGRNEPDNRGEGGALDIDEDSLEVFKNGRPLGLTQREFELINFLAKSKGKVFSREELMEKVWNYDYYGDARTVDVTIRRLREKVEDNPGSPRHIITKRGAGYMFAG